MWRAGFAFIHAVGSLFILTPALLACFSPGIGSPSPSPFSWSGSSRYVPIFRNPSPSLLPAAFHLSPSQIFDNLMHTAGFLTGLFAGLAISPLVPPNPLYDP